MKQIFKEEEFAVPEGVTVAIKARIITVVGPRGTLQRVRTHDRNLALSPKLTLCLFPPLSECSTHRHVDASCASYEQDRD